MPTPFALTSRTQILLGVGLVLLAGLSVHRLWFAGPAGPYVAFGGETMGTTWEVKLASEELGPDEIRDLPVLVQTTIDEVVARMSSWDPDSDVSRFNSHHSIEPFPISSLTAEVLASAERASVATRSAFDVTVSPLVVAWGFGAAGGTPEPPDDATIARMLEHVGHGLLILDVDGPTLSKRDPLVEIDVAAIVQGFAVDRVARALEAEGHRNYLVEVAGELRASGVRLDGRPWRVAIERPSDGLTREIHVTLDLRDLAMATSGDYRNYYEIDGKRISHTIDPRNGRPIAHPLASVSVVDQSAMWADALAKGLNVLGPAAGYHVAETQGIAAYFIIRRGDGGFESRPTTAMQALLSRTEATEGANESE